MQYIFEPVMVCRFQKRAINPFSRTKVLPLTLCREHLSGGAGSLNLSLHNLAVGFRSELGLSLRVCRREEIFSIIVCFLRGFQVHMR